MIYTQIYEDDFVTAFNKMGRGDNFSIEGREALFDYLNKFEDIELDVIAICCEYTEYTTAHEAASQYSTYDGMEFDEDGAEMLTVEQLEQKAISFLEDNTTVLNFDGGVIIRDF